MLELSDYGSLDHFRSAEALVEVDTLAGIFRDIGYISLKDEVEIDSPEHLPRDIEDIFQEGATCLGVRCFNAASTMFRLALDKATRPLLPNPENSKLPQPNSRQRRDLGLRIPWLVEHSLLPSGLRDLVDAVREDGNDGAHQGDVSEDDAKDLLDFTALLLTRLYTEPGKLAVATERRYARRKAREAG